VVRIWKRFTYFLHVTSYTHHANLSVFFCIRFCASRKIIYTFFCIRICASRKVIVFFCIRICASRKTIILYQDLVEESEDDTRFDDISDSQPPIELPAAELARSGFTCNHVVPTISHRYTKVNNGVLSLHPIVPSSFRNTTSFCHLGTTAAWGRGA
jgi:hypothetical protein